MPLTAQQRKQVDLEKVFTHLIDIACEVCHVENMGADRVSTLVYGPHYRQSYEDLVEQVRREDPEFMTLIEGLQKLGMEFLDAMVLLLSSFCNGRLAIECARRIQLPPSERVRPPRGH